MGVINRRNVLFMLAGMNVGLLTTFAVTHDGHPVLQRVQHETIKVVLQDVPPIPLPPIEVINIVAACPSDMIEVEGDFCPRVEEVCLGWVNRYGRTVGPPHDGVTGRCGEFKRPSRCLSDKLQHMHFCIDVYEFPNVAGDKPKSWMSWYDSRRQLKMHDKRICTQAEWTFACEGPKIQPLPYGDGYHRNKAPCNLDNSIRGINVFKAKRPKDPMSQTLQSLLVSAGSLPECVSPFGVHEMVGNIDEWVVNESGGKYVSGLMSGHVFGVRNRCRAITTGHGPSFSWYEVGTRGCRDIK